MALIKPFRGYRPPADLAYKITSPPYDVMTSDEARDMVQNNNDSFLRVIKPEIDFSPENEPKRDDLHNHAKHNLLDYIEKGNLIQDANSCFYLYQITMGNHTQTGIMAAVSIAEYNEGLIKKHEFTQPEKEDDRTRHIEITNANTGPVFLTYRNDGKLKNVTLEILNSHPDISFTADDGTFHTLWKVENKIRVERLINYFQAMPALYIADGHHRAASAARVQKFREDANSHHTGDESYNYFLSVIFPHDEMQILDYNRVVKDLNGLTEEQFHESIKENFDVVPIPHSPLPIPENNYSMHINGKWYQLEALAHVKSDDPVEGLEASILQKYLLTPILDIDDPRTNKRINFVGGIRGMEELERRCQTDCTVAFALPPVSIEQLLSVADSGQVMPPKSTWFEPKLRSGMVVRLLD
ncbi:MAG TPA: DUF1015 domain-containing protein [Candidatus Marinimicrobia bacterium]|nr:DUF1015 domain-containing protein [Candidatus Neomarinimicrobiota bacterium]